LDGRTDIWPRALIGAVENCQSQQTSGGLKWLLTAWRASEYKPGNLVSYLHSSVGEREREKKREREGERERER
jgi:hypothetical protein